MASDTGIKTQNNDDVATRDLVVVRPFTITTQANEKLAYGVGTHKNVPLDIADHWYAQAHAAKPGEEPPNPMAVAAESDKNFAALRVAQEEVTRLQTISQKATDDNAAAQLELTALKERVAELEAERDGLRSQIAEHATHNDPASDEPEGEDDEAEPSSDDVRVHRKGRRWFVDKSGARVGEFATKDAADAKAAELRGAVG